MAKHNHYISRFLLKRFASRCEIQKKKNKKPKYWIWQLSSTSEPREISTYDAAVGAEFYGKSATGVEKAFAEAEGRFGNVLASIDTGQPLQLYAEELRQFVYLQAVRTRPLRERVTGAFDLLLSELPNYLETASTKERFVREAQAALGELIDREIAKLPPDQRPHARAVLENPAVQQMFMRSITTLLDTDHLQRTSELLVRMVQSQGILQKSAEEGHNRGLGKLLQAQGVPEEFNPGYWELLLGEPGSVIVGDACAFAVSEDG